MNSMILNLANMRTDGPLAEFLETGGMPDNLSAADYIQFFKEMGELGRRDEFFFGRIILGYSWLESYHEEWLVDLQNNRAGNKLRMFPRGTGKSTVFTIIDGLWESVHDISKRQLIVNAVEKKAVAFLKAIRLHITTNARFRMCYPEHSDLRVDGKTEIEFTAANRYEIKTEPSFSAIGVRGSLVSSHWDIIRGDDLVGDKDMYSEEIREATIAWFDTSLPLLQDGGRYDITGTPWHKDDLYTYIQRKNEDLDPEEQFYIQVQGAESDKGELNYPNRYTLAKLKTLKKKMPSAIYNSQVLCKHLDARTQLFRYDTMVTFNPYGYNKNWYQGFYAYVDPATGKKAQTSRRPDLDYTAIIIGGLHPEGYLAIFRAFMLQAPPSTVCNVLCDLQREYLFNEHCPIFIEENGFQSVFADHLNTLARIQGVSLTIQKIHNSQNKQARIAISEPSWKTGFLRFREDFMTFEDPITHERSYLEFLNSVTDWPIAKHDDPPDAMAGLDKNVRMYLGLGYQPYNPSYSAQPGLGELVDGDSIIIGNLRA